MKKKSSKKPAVEPEYPIAGLTKMPMGMPYMADMWASCILWAADSETLCADFKEATGMDLGTLVKRTPIDAAIDKATGYQKKVLLAFCDYVTEHVWGM